MPSRKIRPYAYSAATAEVRPSDEQNTPIAENRHTAAISSTAVSTRSTGPTPPNIQAIAKPGTAVSATSSTNTTAAASLPQTIERGARPVESSRSNVPSSRSPLTDDAATAGATTPIAAIRQNAIAKKRNTPRYAPTSPLSEIEPPPAALDPITGTIVGTLATIAQKEPSTSPVNATT